MTHKQRLSTILQGSIPNAPPHFEMAFALEKEMFGMDIEPIRKGTYGSQATRSEALEAFFREVALRCVDDFGYAAITAPHYEKEIDLFRALKNAKTALGGRALTYAFSDIGVIWMPLGGNAFEEFVIRLYEHPEEMHAEARRKVGFTTERIRRQHDAGIDFFIQNTDFGLNSGPFISPAQFGEFCVP